MPDSLKQFGYRAITGQQQSFAASILLAFLNIIEWFYYFAMMIRNVCYDRGVFKTQNLGRPTISVGNITTGGTGKTPVVQWLADELRRRGHRPAILLRGYGSTAPGGSDEAQLLDQSLNDGQQTTIPVQANPSRVQGAADVLRDHPQVTHFILDDGFQHRRARRDFNLVLISATEPFGYGHVLPRGLLREPLMGLDRADAFLITRCAMVSPESLEKIDAFLVKEHPAIPIFHCDHVQSAVLLPSTGQTVPVATLAGKKVFLTAAIGDPGAFEKQIASHDCSIAGVKWFPDHHAFNADELGVILDSATKVGAEMLLTTEKDWVKMKRHVEVDAEPCIGVVQLEIGFTDTDGDRLVALADGRLSIFT